MFNRKGQSTLEYALIIAVVVAGLLVMQNYVKRGYAGRLRQASDEMGEQYDPNDHTGSFTVTQESHTKQTVTDRVSRTEHTDDQISKREGEETIAAYGEDDELYD